MTTYRIYHKGRLFRPTKYNLPRMRKIRFGKIVLLPKKYMTIDETTFQKYKKMLSQLEEVGVISITKLGTSESSTTVEPVSEPEKVVKPEVVEEVEEKVEEKADSLKEPKKNKKTHKKSKKAKTD